MLNRHARVFITGQLLELLLMFTDEESLDFATETQRMYDHFEEIQWYSANHPWV